MAADGAFALFAKRNAVDDRDITELEIFRDGFHRTDDFGPEMITTPKGSFLMGGRKRDKLSNAVERPLRRVRFAKPFALGRYAVTFEEYDLYAATVGAALPDDLGWGRGRRPVINVSWEDALHYCAWLSAQTGERYRLPSEAEWEYACRAGATTPFSTGETISSHQANFNGASPLSGAEPGPFLEQTVEVGGYEPNAWNFHDMHGNVVEWCADCWVPSYEDAPVDGSARRLNAGELGISAVVRGGGWSARAQFVRCSDRWHYGRDSRFEMIGFRVAREI